MDMPSIWLYQWNLSNTDTLGTKIIVLISEVSSIQEISIYTKLGVVKVSWLINQGVHISGVKEVPLYMQLDQSISSYSQILATG